MPITECKPIDGHHACHLGRLHDAHGEEIVIYFIHNHNRCFGLVLRDAFKTGRRENSKFSLSLEGDGKSDVPTIEPVCVGVSDVGLAKAMINYRGWEKKYALCNY